LCQLLYSIKLLLRRSVHLSDHYGTIASQFTQSEAKGRTLVLQQFYSLIVAVACSERSEGFGNTIWLFQITMGRVDTNHLKLELTFLSYFEALTHLTPSRARGLFSHGSSMNVRVKLSPLKLILYFPVTPGQLYSFVL
jgi:hypothetical protein